MPEHTGEMVGAPVPVKRVPGWLNVVSTVVVLSGGMWFFPFACPMTHTYGATRSAHLKWERRQGLIQQAAAKERAGEQREVVLPENPESER
jgi:hypothetical protein